VDLGLDGVEGLTWQGAPFDGQHTAVGDGRLLGAAVNEGAVQVAGAEEGVWPPGQITVEVGERDEQGPGRRGAWRVPSVMSPASGHVASHGSAVRRQEQDDGVAGEHRACHCR
jgi:hypothetical protein